MKKIFKSMMFLAAAATAFTACNKEADIQETGRTGDTETIRLYAVVNDAETKATLTTEDEKTFKAAWEEGDKMEISVSGNGHIDYLFSATRKGSYFEFDIPSDWTEEGTWGYGAYYPSKTGVPFGANRVQNGSNYASQYDVMLHEYSTFANSKCGYDSKGDHVVLPMSRVTSILYFHLTSDLEETLQSATLTVEGGDIAAETLAYNDSESKFVASEGSQTFNTITLTFVEGTAPSAKDFCLWYNILPVDATGLTLTVTTTSGKTATLTNTTGKTYAAGKLNKIVKSVTWEEGAKYYVKVTKDEDLKNGTYLIVSEDETMSVAFNGGLSTLDVVSNNIIVEVSDGKILSTEETDAAAFTISVDEGSILSKSGRYIGASTYGNGLVTSEESEFNNSISIDSEENAIIAISFDEEDVTLRYNSASNQNRFRYYKSGQKPVTLYLLEGSGSNLKPSANLSFPAEYHEITLGDSFNGLTLTTEPAGLSITWTSSNEAVATVDATGKVTVLAPGTTTITASFSGNNSYGKASASYVLKVNSNIDNGDGTINNPFNIAGVYEYINNSETEDVYVRGIISRIDEGKEFSESYGTAVFWISEDGSLNSDQFEAYSVYFLKNRNWKEENTQIKVGDEVILYGKVTLFGTIYETSSKNAYLYSLNGETEILDIPVVEVSDNGLNISVSWGAVEGATSYLVVCGDQSYTASSTETSKTFAMSAYDTYMVYVVAKAEGVEPGVSNRETITLSNSSSTTVDFTANTAGLTTTQGEQTATIKDVTINISSGVGNQQIRIYKNGKITISVPEGKKITEIVFTCTAKNDAQYGPGCFSAIDGYSYSDYVGTWSGSSSSVSFTASSNQVRATIIKVTYE